MPDNASIRERIGKRIETARGERTRRDIATALGVSTQTVWFWETGATSPAPDKQVALARELGVRHTDLFGLDNEVA